MTKQAFTNKRCHVPVLSGMEKDQKQVEEADEANKTTGRSRTPWRRSWRRQPSS